MKFTQKTGLFISMVSFLSIAGCSASDMQTLTGTNTAMATTSNHYAAIAPSKVKLYYSSTQTPKKYKVIGRASVNNDNPLGIPHSPQTIAQELKQQAASIGGNGVINISTGLEQTTGDVIIIR